MKENKSNLGKNYKKRLVEEYILDGYILEEVSETIEILYKIDEWFNEESEKQEALEEKFRK